MSVIGTLAVNIVARTQKFVDGLKKGRKGVKQFADDVKKTEREVDKLRKTFDVYSAFLGTTGATASFVFARSQLEVIDRLGQVSEKLGIAVDDLQVLQKAGQDTGIRIESVNTGLQRMVRRVSEVASTGKGLTEFLSSVGLSAKSLNELKPADQFSAIATALNKLPQQKKVEAAFKIFDTEGVELIRLFGTNLETVRDRLEETVGIVQPEHVERAQEFNKAFGDLKDTVTGIGRSFTIELAPGMTQVIELGMSIKRTFEPLIDILDRVRKFALSFGVLGVADFIKRQRGEGRAPEFTGRVSAEAAATAFGQRLPQEPPSAADIAQRQADAKELFAKRQQEAAEFRKRRDEFRAEAWRRGEAKRMAMMGRRRPIDQSLLLSENRMLESGLLSLAAGGGLGRPEGKRDEIRLSEKQLSTQEQIRDALAGAPRIEITEGAGL